MRLRPLHVDDRALVRADLRAVGHRVVRIQRMGQLVRRQELVRLRLLRDHHRAGDVRNEVAVLANELGQEHAMVLAHTVVDQAVIESLLRRLGPAHEPALVARGHGVRVLRTEVAGRIQGPVRDAHL